MSLTSAMYTGVSGLQANSNALNVIGNNIANVNTVGFKDSTSVFASMLSDSIGNNAQVGTGVQMQTVQSNFTQGTSQSTSVVSDLDIQGNGLFALAAPGSASATTSTAFLSRAGNFTVNANNTLVNPSGYEVLGTDGKPITFPSTGVSSTDFGSITSIAPNGLITYLAADGVTQNYYNGNGVAPTAVSAGTPATPVGVAVVTAADPSALTNVGGSLYQANASAGVSATFSAPNGTSEQVLSDSLESSNVDLSTEFVNMITTQRAYTANSKTITTADEMTQDVLGLIR